MKTLTLTHYDLFADLFEYPSQDFPTRVQRAIDTLAEDYPEAAASLRLFAQALPPSDGTFSEEQVDEIQELFTRSFDVQSITTLGVGYVVFGDDYKRGELLVNLNREHREAGIDCGTELSDHLPTVLRLLSRWKDEETMLEFAEQVLHPALDRMISEFGPDRIQQRNTLYKKHYKTVIESSQERGIIFREPLAALLGVLKQDFELSKLEQPELNSVFLSSVVREMEIEAKSSRPKEAKSSTRRARREPRRIG